MKKYQKMHFWLIDQATAVNNCAELEDCLEKKEMTFLPLHGRWVMCKETDLKAISRMSKSEFDEICEERNDNNSDKSTSRSAWLRL